MKYVSIDLETTGLDYTRNQILEFGAVIEDTSTKLPIEDLPKFQVYIDNGNEIVGNPFALQMNAAILKRIATKEAGFDYIYPNELGTAFKSWLMSNGITPENDDRVHINVAGKNFGTFDLNFLNVCEDFNTHIRIRQRIVDPAILCINWETDETLPSLPICKERTGVAGEVTHNAVEDAIDVINVLRNFY